MSRWRTLMVTLSLIIGVGFCMIGVRAGSPLARASYFSLNRELVSTSTIAQVYFQATTGINLPADTIQITLPDEFDVSGLSLSDIVMTYGPGGGPSSSATLFAGSAGVDIWGVARTGNTFTFSPPSNAMAGNIPVGDWISIFLGRTVGVTTYIVNPATPGVYRIFVGGAFGDPIALATLVQASDTMQVTATVPEAAASPAITLPAPGGTGTGSPTLDGAAPIISSLRAESITTNQATIHWNTDESADGYLEYGLTSSYTLGSRAISVRSISQSVTLESLLPDTTYHLRVRARDAVGNTSWSGDFSFHTAAVIPLRISGLQVTYVDDHQAIIEWTTNLDAVGTVALLSPITSVTSEPSARRTHSLTLNSLSPGTSYTFRASAVAATDESAEATGTFVTTIDRTPPTNVSGFRGALEAETRAVVLHWSNPTDSDFLRVTITRQDSTGGPQILVCVTSSQTCTDAIPSEGGSFIYRAVAEDAAHNLSSGAVINITISAIRTPSTPPTTPSTEIPRTDSTEGPSITPLQGTTTDGGSPPTPTSPTGSSDATQGTIQGSAGGSATVSDSQTTLPLVVPSGGGSASSTPTIPVTDAGTSVGSERTLELSSEFFLSETIPASPDTEGVRAAVMGRSIQVRVSTVGISSSLVQAQVELSSGSIYQLSYHSSLGAYVADFTFDQGLTARQAVLIRARSASGELWEQSYSFDLIPPAQVTDADSHAVLSLATTTIAVISMDPAGTTIFAEVNSSNSYAFILPNGQYRLRVLGAGYRPYEVGIDVTRGVFAQMVQLRTSPRSFTDIISTATSVKQMVTDLKKETMQLVTEGVERVRAPEVQAVTQDIIAPTVVVTTIGTTATAVSGFAFLNYLRFLFTQPLLLLGRRKRKSWGVIYNALSKQPIELAIVRLMRPGTNFAIQTHITDAQGRFSFLAPIGSYTIQVQKPGYRFPSEYLKEEKMDVDFVDLYHGEEIKVAAKTSISPNIPLDPVVKEELPATVIRKRQWRTIQSVLGIGGIGVSLVALFILPSWQMLAFVAFQLVTYLLFRRLAIPTAPKRWGIVYDSDGKRPLAKAVIRIFDKKFNKLLETQVTEKDGTYGFFAAKGVYYLTADKVGYERYLSSDVDLRQAKDTYIDYRFSLKRAETNS